MWFAKNSALPFRILCFFSGPEELTVMESLQEFLGSEKVFPFIFASFYKLRFPECECSA